MSPSPSSDYNGNEDRYIKNKEEKNEEGREIEITPPDNGTRNDTADNIRSTSKNVQTHVQISWKKYMKAEMWKNPEIKRRKNYISQQLLGFPRTSGSPASNVLRLHTGLVCEVNQT